MNPSPIPQSDFPGLNEKVADALHRSVPEDDIILRVCETTGWNWEIAETFVAKVTEDTRDRTSIQKRTIIILIGAVTILGGGILSGYMIYLGYLFLQMNMVQASHPITFLYFFDYLVNQVPFILEGLIFGLVIMAGGAYGIGKELGN